jgi:hypothetical protein
MRIFIMIALVGLLTALPPSVSALPATSRTASRSVTRGDALISSSGPYGVVGGFVAIGGPPASGGAFAVVGGFVSIGGPPTSGGAFTVSVAQPGAAQNRHAYLPLLRR